MQVSQIAEVLKCYCWNCIACLKNTTLVDLIVVVLAYCYEQYLDSSVSYWRKTLRQRELCKRIYLL